MPTINKRNYPKNGNIVLPKDQMFQFLKDLGKSNPFYEDTCDDYCRIELRNGRIIVDHGDAEGDYYRKFYPECMHSYQQYSIILTKRRQY